MSIIKSGHSPLHQNPDLLSWRKTHLYWVRSIILCSFLWMLNVIIAIVRWTYISISLNYTHYAAVTECNNSCNMQLFSSSKTEYVAENTETAAINTIKMKNWILSDLLAPVCATRLPCINCMLLLVAYLLHGLMTL